MKEGSQGRRPTGGAGPAAARSEVPAAVDEEAVVAALAAPPVGEGPRLPDSCKLLLKELAEEMLVMHSRQDTAEQRAELAERKLARRGHAADAAVEEARRQAAEAEDHAATLQRQLTEAQQQLEQERRLRQAAEERAAELERQLAAAQPQGRRQRQQQQQQEQQEQQADEGMRQLGREMLAGARGGAAAQQRQQQQQQQRVEAVDRPLPPEQPAAVPAAHAGAARVAAAPGGQSSIEIALHSSDDDETLPGPAGAAGTAAAAAAEAHPAGAKSGEEEAAAAAQPAAMRPPPQRLGSLRGAVNPARQNASRKRPAEASLAAAAAAAGRAQAAQRDEEPSPAKQRRREAPAVDERRRESGRGGLQRLDSASPGESALDALDALGRRMRRNSSAAAAAAAGGSSALSPSSREGGPDLLLRLADAGQAGWEGEEEEEEEEEEGPRRRNGRRTVGAVAGVVTLKPGETAGQWLNRSIVAYVGTLARERDFRPFEKPVPRSTPDYYALVKKPMDMATVKIKAQRGQYSSPKEFKSDMMLIVDNAKFYNESEKHPVHKAADLLRDYLRKPHSFFSKVDAEFKQAETAAVLNEERAAQEAELELEEERLARSVKKGMIVAVYGADDINGNKYYLLQATGPMLRLRADDTDDFGVTYGKGDTVIEGHYYDYWNRADGEWDRSGGRRPYFLLENMRGLVPASSLLLVDVKLRERPETEISPFVGEQTIYEVSPELHKQLKKAIKKFTAEPAA